MTAPVHPGGWVDGIGWVALGSSLGPSDLFARWQGDPPRPKHPYRMCDRTPVIVTCWADGTVPTPVPSHPDSIQFRLRQFTPHHPVASGRQAMLDAADALDVARWPDGTTPQAPTVDSVPEADDVLLSLADDVAEVTEARRIYGRNFGAMGTPGSFVGPMPSERYELALAKILSAVRSHLAAAGVSSDR